MLQGLKAGAPAAFDLPGLYQVSCLLSCSSKSHKIPPRMHEKLTIFRSKIRKKISGKGALDLDFAGETRLLSWTTSSTSVSEG